MLVGIDVTLPVQAPLALIGDAGEDLEPHLSQARAELAGDGPQPREETKAEAPAAESPTTQSVPKGRILASRAVRRAAHEQGIALEDIAPGSGPGGRIVLSDLDELPAGETVRRPMSPMRRAIAANVTASKQTIPHFYMKLTIDAGPLRQLHAAEKSEYGCTLGDILLVASARTLRAFPAFRTRLEKDEIIKQESVHVGVAVALEDGLVVPVVHNADRLDLKGVSEASRHAAEMAKSEKIAGGGAAVFTISNLGMFGVEEFSAIINPPEAAILAIGAIRETVLVENGHMRPGHALTMVLSADHRLVDGALAARFLAHLRALLGEPGQLRSCR